MLADKLNYQDDDAFEPVLVPQGESLAFGFLIEEYDGSEIVKLKDDILWIKA